MGQRNRGKKQLRIDEAQKLVDLCIRKANGGDEAAVGVLMAFLLGLRASEVTDRVVRDLDDDGRLLWIEFGKTRRSRRTLEVPALLRPYLFALAKGRAPDEQLISRTVSRRSGKKRDRYWLAHHVERLCDEACVPVVFHAVAAGLPASVATDAGATSHVVAAALGHASPTVTHAHYIDGGHRTPRTHEARDRQGRTGAARGGRRGCDRGITQADPAWQPRGSGIERHQLRRPRHRGGHRQYRGSHRRTTSLDFHGRKFA